MLINCTVANHTVYLGIKYQNPDIEFKYDNTMRSRICKPKKTFMSFHFQNSIYIFPQSGYMVLPLCQHVVLSPS